MSTAGALDLFVYGTLCDETVMRRVAGRFAKAAEARLYEYRCLAVRGESYPAIVPAPGYAVPGFIYTLITPDGWRRLDAYEGHLYDRLPVTVEISQKRRQRVYAYVINRHFRDRLADREWDVGCFWAERRT